MSIARKIGLVLIAAFSAQAFGATYYVAKTGNNANPGSEGSPWLTIQHAITNAVAGDTVTVKAGVYNEYLSMRNQGTDVGQITFQGERGASGEWLTIIDPSTNASTGWVAAPEIGTGVYKITTPFEARELQIGHQRVAYCWTTGTMTTDIDSCYSSSGMTTGAHLLTQPTDRVVNVVGNNFNFWDGVEALWSASTTTVYLRLRDGSDPNGLTINISKNGAALTSFGSVSPAIAVLGWHYITFKDFWIRGAASGILMSGAGAHHNIIQSNRITGGLHKVVIQTGASNNIVQGNLLATDFYGGESGSWSNGTDAESYRNRHHYVISKYLMGSGSVFDTSVYLNQAGQSNVITGNTIPSSLGMAIALIGAVATPTTGTEISTNWISGHPSNGILIDTGETDTHVFGNTIYDSDANMRLHDLNHSGETDRLVYVYRNKSWLPTGIGQHIFLFYNATPQTYMPEIWVYHNSYSGGTYGIQGNSFMDENGGADGLRVLNNIFSDTLYFTAHAGVYLAADMFGAYDYNLLADCVAGDLPLWFGAGNVEQVAAEWTAGDTVMFPFTGSGSIDAALDLSQTFTAKGTNYTALPDVVVKVGSAWDIGAMEYTPPPATPPSRRKKNKGFGFGGL